MTWKLSPSVYTAKRQAFQQWKNFENRLGFDKVIVFSWVVHFLGTQYITAHDCYVSSVKIDREESSANDKALYNLQVFSVNTNQRYNNDKIRTQTHNTQHRHETTTSKRNGDTYIWRRYNVNHRRRYSAHTDAPEFIGNHMTP